MSGLYKVIAQTKNGVIVESLADKKRFPAFASHKISALEDISMYSTGDDVPLKDVFQKIKDKEKGGPAPDLKKDDKEVIKYFGEVFSDYDKERVRVSDMKKALTWYNTLQSLDLLKDEEKAEEADDKKPAVQEKEKAKPSAKGKPKSVSQKPVKTSSAKVKTQGVRKTGSA